ncbi:NAD(P)H-binding protein [Kribbella sp. NPDC003505]|uniref:SDR family oxidoreductase n=1 Tax=Kribbella sp. NPDC003505 TaxID=3154448 RepID=UPI0033B15ACC
MVSTVAVAGATGAVGRHVVANLRDRGLKVLPIARSLGVDLVTGAGLREALTGADAIIDVCNVVTTGRRASVDFFGKATANLVDAAEALGIERYVLLSIVGIDEVDYGYYEGKRIQEKLLRDSEVPHTILRATQFHEFAAQMLERMSWGPIALVPMFKSAPVAAEEVADRLVELATFAPSARNLHLELCGPEVLDLGEMTARICRRTGRQVLRVPLPVPGKPGRSMRKGGLLPRGVCEVGSQTFDDWLRHR